VLFGALLIHLGLAIVFAARSAQPAFDFDRYYEIATQPGRPYVDRAVEHAVATVAVFEGLVQLSRGRGGFGLGIVLLNLVADALIVGALLIGWGEAAAAVFAVLLVPVLDLFFNRIDPWPVAAATVAVAAWRQAAPRTAGAALALGVGFKLWPIALAGILFAPPRAAVDAVRFRRNALAAFAVIGGALGVTTLLVAGWRGVSQVVTFRGATGWHIESLVGSLTHLLGGRPRFESGAWRVGLASGPVSIGLFALAAPLGIWSSWRGARSEHPGAGWLAAIAVLLLFSSLFSAQYIIWLLPAAAIAWTEKDRVLVCLTAVALILTGAFWSTYASVTASQTPVLVVVVLRNVVMFVLAAASLRRLARASG
jgi:hypothetical protein